MLQGTVCGSSAAKVELPITTIERSARVHELRACKAHLLIPCATHR